MQLYTNKSLGGGGGREREREMEGGREGEKDRESGGDHYLEKSSLQKTCPPRE